MSTSDSTAGAIVLAAPSRIVPRSLDEKERVARYFILSGYFGAKNLAEIMTKILAGEEFGMAPFSAMQSLHIVQGKPVMAANAIAARVKASGHYNYRIRRLDNTGCSIEFFEGGHSVGISSFDQKDAEDAGLLGKDNWKKFKRNMYFSRAISNGARWYCPDVYGGSAVYTAEELDPDTKIDTQTGEVITVTAAPEEPVERAKEAAVPPQSAAQKANEWAQLKADVEAAVDKQFWIEMWHKAQTQWKVTRGSQLTAEQLAEMRTWIPAADEPASGVGPNDPIPEPF